MRAVRIIGIFLWALSLCLIFECRKIVRITATPLDRPPFLFPDIVGITIPPNIAPLHFKVLETTGPVFVRIVGETGDTLTLRSASPKVRIPLPRWRRLLVRNTGKTLEVQIFTKGDGKLWNAFAPFPIRIAPEPVDPYLVYREIGPVYIYWNRMRLVQRHVESFQTRTLLDNRRLGTTCMNCHAFRGHDPGAMLLHVRRGPGTGMLLVQGDAIDKVDTQVGDRGPAAFVSWHPSGKHIAFSVNQFKQFFHALGENRDVVDLDSDLYLYHVGTHTITTDPRISDPESLETWPEWSADGKSLYFCRARRPKDWHLPYSELQKIRYDLVRIPYYPDGTWGEIETLVDAEKVGLSAAQPKASPDGRWILFCLSAYGNFTTFRPSSDLYLYDLTTGEIRDVGCNSDQSESYHAWSSNGRWIIFSSKRRDGICHLPYLCYVDEEGNGQKPFLLPQDDPERYETGLFNYHLPEWIIRPIPVSENRLIRALYRKQGVIQALTVNLPPGRIEKTDSEMWAPGE